MYETYPKSGNAGVRAGEQTTMKGWNGDSKTRYPKSGIRRTSTAQVRVLKARGSSSTRPAADYPGKRRRFPTESTP